jgi:hypothetical protein
MFDFNLNMMDPFESYPGTVLRVFSISQSQGCGREVAPGSVFAVQTNSRTWSVAESTYLIVITINHRPDAPSDPAQLASQHKSTLVESNRKYTDMSQCVQTKCNERRRRQFYNPNCSWTKLVHTTVPSPNHGSTNWLVPTHKAHKIKAYTRS